MAPSPAKRPWLGLAVFLVLCFGVATLGGVATTPNIPNWYAGLVKPSWTPPNWIFGPVWCVLYFSMAVTQVVQDSRQKPILGFLIAHDLNSVLRQVVMGRLGRQLQSAPRNNAFVLIAGQCVVESRPVTGIHRHSGQANVAPGACGEDVAPKLNFQCLPDSQQFPLVRVGDGLPRFHGGFDSFQPADFKLPFPVSRNLERRAELCLQCGYRHVLPIDPIHKGKPLGGRSPWIKQKGWIDASEFQDRLGDFPLFPLHVAKNITLATNAVAKDIAVGRSLLRIWRLLTLYRFFWLLPQPVSKTIGEYASFQIIERLLLEGHALAGVLLGSFCQTPAGKLLDRLRQSVQTGSAVTLTVGVIVKCGGGGVKDDEVGELHIAWRQETLATITWFHTIERGFQWVCF